MVRVFGIRHHGPGSALRLREALEAFAPDALLLELPADLAPALAFAGAGTTPPVALLGYDPKRPRQAAYLPFASFSPEWQALQYAQERSVELRPVDLPLGRLFGLHRDGEGQVALHPDASEEERRMRHDPLSFLARLAGYDDSERWWEVHFEQGPGGEETFALILDTMRALRSELDRPESRETLAREGHMRLGIRQALADGFGSVAVVCGAWHAPVLQDWADFTAAADKKLLRGLRQRKVAATWVPWSYDRLSRRGGYRAGVVSPAWYELLFRDRGEATVRWMSRAVQLLRSEGQQSSPAQATEAVRLAESLAALRGRNMPGLSELEDAALAVLCGGSAERLALIHRRLAVGEKLGTVAPEAPAAPLQRDLERCIRSARLTREWKTARRLTKELDLRKPANRLASHLLHRLRILDIPWGERRAGSEGQLGSFRETWSLKWRPEFTIRLIERGMLGNTVRQASAEALLRTAAKDGPLNALTTASEKALLADLTEVFDQLLLLTRHRAALMEDIEQLMDAFPALARVWRYGDTRRSDTEAVAQLIRETLPRIAIGLPAVATRRDEEAARNLFDRILAVGHAVGLLDDPECREAWERSLDQLAIRKGIHPLLQGLANRLAFDRHPDRAEGVGRQLSLALSPGEDPMHSALWLEGFLHGSGLLFVHHPPLWKLLDEWVDGLDIRALPRILPLLRRAFANFSAHERAALMDLARYGPEAGPGDAGPELQEALADLTRPVLDRLLGPREGDPGN